MRSAALTRGHRGQEKLRHCWLTCLACVVLGGACVGVTLCFYKPQGSGARGGAVAHHLAFRRRTTSFAASSWTLRKTLRRAAADTDSDAGSMGLPGDLDWRSFRARLIERTGDGSLIEERFSKTDEGSQGEASGREAGREEGLMIEPGWAHCTPLIERGTVLLSRPGPWAIEFPHFHKAVIFIVEHSDAHGDMGFILNRPTSRICRLGDVEFNIWYGGPCQGLDQPPSEQWSYCLHTRPDLAEGEPIVPGVFFAAPGSARWHVAEGRARAEEFTLFVGHCGWALGQLQDEVDDGETWTMVAADSRLLFGAAPRRQVALTRSRHGLRKGGVAALSRGFPMWRRLFRRVDNAEPLNSGMLEKHADAVLWDWVRNFLAHDPNQGHDDMRNDQESPAEYVLQQVLAVMVANPEAAFTQEQGCEALRTLVADDSSRTMVMSHGGIEAVLRAMMAHPGEAGVQGHCCGTLTHIAAGADARRQIFSDGGLQAILKGMRDHPGSALVQYKGCGALANMASSAAEQAEVASLGGAAAVLAAMEAHPEELEVQDYCCGALYNLAASGANRALIASMGGIHAVSQAVQAQPQASTVQRLGLTLLDMLQRDST